MSYFEKIGHHLAGLARFTGRDPNNLFWPWAATVVVLRFIAGFVIVIPMLADMFSRMAAYQAAHQGQPLPVQKGPGGMATLPPELMPDVSNMIIPGIIISIVTILLLAASAVRRLHDRGKGGWWALLPVPFSITGMVLGRSTVASMSHGMNPETVRLAALNGLLFWVALIWLVVLLAGPSEEEENRYGPPPSH